MQRWRQLKKRWTLSLSDQRQLSLGCVSPWSLEPTLRFKVLTFIQHNLSQTQHTQMDTHAAPVSLSYAQNGTVMM